jgi:hypothetical protein
MKHSILIIIVLVMAASASGTITFDDFLPGTTDTYDIGSATLKFEDGHFNGTVDAAIFTGNGGSLTGIGSGTGGVININSTTVGADSDANGVGILALQTRGSTRLTVANNGDIVIAGTVTGGTWNGTAIDISSYTNLAAGTNITLSGDTLNVDDAFLVNNADDVMAGALTTNGLTITTTNALTLGSTQWDDGSDKIDGEQIADDSIDDDSLDFTDITLADFTADIASTGLTDTAEILYETELDAFGELQAQIADKTLINEEDAATIDSAWTFSSGITGAVTGNADTATALATARTFEITGDAATASASNFDGTGNVSMAVTLAAGVIVNEDISNSAAVSADKLTDGAANAIPTLTQESNWDAAYTHVSNTGSDHTYIDQDVTAGAGPNFDNANMTGNVSVFTNDAGYIDATLTEEAVQDYVGAMTTGNTETLIAVTYRDEDGTIDFVVDEASINHDSLTGFQQTEHYLQGAITETGTIVSGIWRATPIRTAYIADDTITDEDLNLTDITVSDFTNDSQYLTPSTFEVLLVNAADSMISDNTETLIDVAYQEEDHTIDFVVDNDLHKYDWSNTDATDRSAFGLGTEDSPEFTGLTVSGNIEGFRVHTTDWIESDSDIYVGRDLFVVDGVSIDTLTTNTLVINNNNGELASAAATYDSATGNITMGVDDIVFNGAAGNAVGGVSWANTAYGDTAKFVMGTSGLFGLTMPVGTAFGPTSTNTNAFGDANFRWASGHINALIGSSLSNDLGDLTITAAGGDITFDDENHETAGKVGFGAGSAAAPGLYISGLGVETNCGFSRKTANEWIWSAGGSETLNFSEYGFLVNVNGSAAAPSVTFSDYDNGIFLIAANRLGLSAGGAEVMELNSTGAEVTGNLATTGDLDVNGNDIDLGDAGGFSGFKFVPATTTIDVYIDGNKIGHFSTDGSYTDDVP